MNSLSFLAHKGCFVEPPVPAYERVRKTRIFRLIFARHG